MIPGVDTGGTFADVVPLNVSSPAAPGAPLY